MTYLVKRNALYYFRFRVPADLIEVFGGRKEVWRSLGTSLEKKARRRCAILSERTEPLLSILRSRMISDEEAKKMVANYVSQGLKLFEDWRFTEIPEPASAQWNSLPVETMERVQDAFKKDLVDRQYKKLSRILKDFLAETKLKVKKGSPEYRRLARYLLIGFVDFLRIEIERRHGNYTNDFDSVLKNDLPRADAAVKEPADDGLVITEVIKRYFAERESGNRWDIRTKQQVESTLNLMLEILGDRPAKTINRNDVLDVQAKIAHLPSNRNKSPKYRGRSIDDVLAMKNIKPMEVTTANNILTRISTFWNWAERNDFIVKSPARNIAIPISLRADEEREKYDKEELQKLFDALARESQPDTNPARVWLPLIMLYSGIRPKEVAQLYLDDVFEKDGILCFRIDRVHPDQRIKTKSSKRNVPVHPVIIDLGFNKYFEKVKSNLTERLFPKLKLHRDGYYQYLGNWLQKINRDYVTTNRKRVIYSLRHNFTTALKDALVKDSIIDEITGHSAKGESLERYAKTYQPAVPLEAIKKVDYGLDLTAIREATSKTY